MKNLKGRNAILTGGSYGVGPYFARALAREGVNIALVARSADKLEQVAEEIRSIGVKAIAIPADISDAVAREAVLTRTRSELGQIDILINNAGVHYCGRIHTRTMNEVDEIIQTNLTASILLSRAVLPDMLKRRQGHLVHSASLAGKIGIPYIAAYAATKHGLVGFNSALQAELKGTGVHSTSMCWGYISKAGMWSRFKRPVHIGFGLSSPERVARALVSAIKHNQVERIVNPIPEQPIIMMASVAPGLTSKLFGAIQVDRFMRGAAIQAEVKVP